MDTVWVGVAFVIFFAILAYFGVPKAIVAALDARGEKVAQELAEARRLRLEAEKLLAEYEAKRKAAETEAASIVAAANEEAKRLAAEAETKLNDFVARRTKSAEEKIALAESQAEAEVRAAAAEAATKAAELIIRSQVGGKAGDALFAAGLNEVKAKLN
ncbi:MAG: ATP F0F1 synthase subunit B [Bosea sp. (in: a-proteobacteria)]|jgi:F-type H+-transporting ATPase subunit b|uniref:F0F1 ATP synthase subunit B family protein n=1 Tax=unclassified Bosea (in: a-proteobacteria) TaxID=2653178 RepID=UPI00083D99D4|nr:MULTISPECIES: ATP F0F1 synthase subunit B [unclassified Bosea (in: a-proteobacteria)]MBA4270769.1 ATP F0F1 synthase subunit B [Methylobacterium sp.]MCZ8041424.1 ATP F0F1 synthase subunit B [Beijerinckiaceae bacterium]AOG06324.1 ATP synthase B/B' CF family protein [Bosea sp. RAC05]MDP3601038.1 ATP F0F1 synthase subunit B [Bosea sp. (in: a-proteobacteria)]WRH57957.1 MAG: ATP F0F1 synthase subunit B [Bosea sp. (in: a-proteobacteria)]